METDITQTPTEIEKLLDGISEIIYSDDKAVGEKLFLRFVNQEPRPSWIREMNGIPYIPVGILETLMQKVFGRVRYEVKDTKIIANSVTVTVRVHYWNANYLDWDWQDGVGAIPIQIGKDKGQGAIDFAHMNSKAIQLGLPAAKSFAIKDAIEHIGRVFGRDLSRKDSLEYSETFTEKKTADLTGFSK